MPQPLHLTRTATRPSRCLPRKTMPRPLPPSPFRTTPQPRARAPWSPALQPPLRLQTRSPQLRSTARLQSSARMARLRRSPSNPRQTPLSKAPSPRSSSRMVRPFRSSHKASATLTSPTTSSRATATRSTAAAAAAEQWQPVRYSKRPASGWAVWLRLWRRHAERPESAGPARPGPTQ